jgi:trigger factor
LRGAKVGEVREFPVTYAADYPQKTLAGKTFSYRVEIQSIKRKVVPPADDELAKSVSEFATLEELRSKLRQDWEKDAQRQAEISSKNKLAEKLLEAHQFPVPEMLVEIQLDRKIERTLGQLLSQGIDPRQTQVDWKKVREDARPEAEKEVRVVLVLNRVADAEKIDLTEEEVDDVIRDMAKERHMNAAELKTRLTRDGKLDTLKSTRRNQKALDFIYRNAKIIRKNA